MRGWVLKLTWTGDLTDRGDLRARNSRSGPGCSGRLWLAVTKREGGSIGDVDAVPGRMSRFAGEDDGVGPVTQAELGSRLSLWLPRHWADRSRPNGDQDQ